MRVDISDPLSGSDDCLRIWQRTHVESLLTQTSWKGGCADVTFVAYWFWNDERFVTNRFQIQVPILMTRLHCGDIPGVLIANRTDPELDAFCDRYRVRLVIDSSLRHGIRQLNTDYILNLHRRFATPYCLTIQDDGFPVRSGLEGFVGHYDYIGAPWDLSKDDWITRVILGSRNAVGNGGFSLRSHAICEKASWYFRRRYKIIPYCYLRLDDFFFCRVLPAYERRYRESIRFAPALDAARFALEKDWGSYERAGGRTFGFHGIPAFERLLRDQRMAIIGPEGA